MKSRNFRCEWFTDPYIDSLSLEEEKVYLTLLYCEKVNLIFCYEITLKYLSLISKVDIKKLPKILDKLQSDNKIRMFENYVFLINANRYSGTGGEKFEKGKQQAIERLSPNIRKWYLDCCNNKTDTTMIPVSYQYDTSNININNNLNLNEGGMGETKKQKEKTSKNSRLPCTEQEFYEIARKYKIGVEDVIAKHEDVVNWFANHKTNHISTYLTLENWLRRDIKKGEIQSTYPLIDDTIKIDKIDVNAIKQNPHLLRQSSIIPKYYKYFCYHIGIVPPEDL